MATAVQLIPVESSNIAAIGFDPATQTLTVEFVAGKTQARGGLYEYVPVSAEMHAALMAYESKGSYFSQHIKNNPSITCTKVVEPVRKDTTCSDVAAAQTPAMEAAPDDENAYCLSLSELDSALYRIREAERKAAEWTEEATLLRDAMRRTMIEETGGQTFRGLAGTAIVAEKIDIQIVNREALIAFLPPKYKVWVEEQISTIPAHYELTPAFTVDARAGYMRSDYVTVVKSFAKLAIRWAKGA